METVGANYQVARRCITDVVDDSVRRPQHSDAFKRMGSPRAPASCANIQSSFPG